MNALDEMIVTIDTLDHQGRGIARVSGMTIFVDGALPFEQVRIKVQKVKKKIVEASVIEWIKKSGKRVNAPCPYYDFCGGCDLMHMNLEDQISYKENKVKEIMVRYADLELNKIKPMIQNEQMFYYRNKVTFQVKEKIGFYKKKSYEIISIDACMIAHPKINEILKVLKSLPLENITQIVVRISQNGKESMVTIYYYDEIEKEKIKEILAPHVTSIILNNGKEEVLYGDSIIYEKLGNYTFAISSSSFFQVNSFMTEKLYQKVLESLSLTGKETVLDLYCGTGTIGIFLSEQVKEVVGMEINPAAIENANHNKEINQVENITFYVGDVSKSAKKIPVKPDVIVVDPPRAGLDMKALETILEKNPKRIIYVSCDPMTLARDLKLLSGSYHVLEVTPVDMFTQTYHVECVCLLERL